MILVEETTPADAALPVAELRAHLRLGSGFELAASAEEDRAWSRLGIDDPMQILGEKATQNPGRAATGRKLPPTERKALDILEARDSWTRAEIRKQYKSLVKDLHPDMNGGNRSDEDRLQEVVWAWDQIKDIYSQAVAGLAKINKPL